MRLIILSAMLLAPAAAQNALWVDLSGEWRVTAEDQREFARPDFDDSKWGTRTLPAGEFARGGLPSAKWFWRRVDLPPGTDRTRLAVTVGTIQNGVEVWINGQRIGATGEFTSWRDTQIARPRTFPIPASAVSEMDSLLIALHRGPDMAMTLEWRMPDRGPWLLTYSEHAPAEAGPQAMKNHRLEQSPGQVSLTVYLCIALFSFLAWTGDRRRWEFLALSAYTLVLAARWGAVLFLLANPGVYPFLLPNFTIDNILYPPQLPTFFEIVFWALGYREHRWRWIFWLFFSVYPVTLLAGMRGNYFLHLTSVLCASLIAAMVVRSWWRSRGSGAPYHDHALHLALLIPALARINYSMATLGWAPSLFPRAFFAAGHRIQPNDVFAMIVAIAILGLLVRRLRADRREQQRLAGELQSARIVQQFLLDQPTPPGSHSPVEAVYEPAQEVGGDFYQTFALPGGTSLVAVGDVSGKGLKAAMVVSLLTGALRNRKSSEPAALLRELNLVVAGSLSGGFVTASIARCQVDGQVTIANAGNPAPYLAGEEVALEAGLPLGLDRDAQYTEQSFALRPGEQLTFVSDGVVEAENPQRELFGFDRTREISTKSAQEIAAAAKAWGQNDDITVVTVRRQA